MTNKVILNRQPVALQSNMQDYFFLNKRNTHPFIRVAVHVGKTGHFHFGLTPTGNAAADIWVRWNDTRYSHVAFDHITLCAHKQVAAENIWQVIRKCYSVI